MAATLLAIPVSALAERIVVIGHPDLPQDELTVMELKSIYLGQTQFLKGTKMVPLDYGRPLPIKTEFVKTVLAMTPLAFQVYWVKEVFRSGTAPPRKVMVPGELITSVTQTPGAIGYVYESDLQGGEGVKKLLFLN